jgi:hypothetical protein
MSTKLEAMVGLLAGRKVEPALLEELADPSSEASRFLEATRARSRALLDDPGSAEPPRPIGSRRGGIITLGALVVGLITLVAAMLWVVDRRFQALEARLSSRDIEAREDARRLEVLLAKLAEPRPSPQSAEAIEAALERIETALSGLDKLEKGQEPMAADPSIAQVRDQLALLRHELSATDKVEVRRFDELQASIRETSRLLKLLLGRSEPSTSPEPSPSFNPPRPPVGGGDPRRAKP